MRPSLLVTAAVLAASTALPALAQSGPALTEPRDWGATLAADARALHDIMADSHPGSFDPLNPEFRPRLDRGLDEALEQARTADSVGGWWWALRAYVAEFEDGHVQIGLKDQTYGFPTRWPGFLTVYRGADQVVADREEADLSAPPLEARLIDCDGVGAETLAADRVGRFQGRWFLEAQRARHGDSLFLNPSNPWIGEMRQCRFEVEGQARAYDLAWRAAPDDLRARRARLGQRAATDFAMTRLQDGGVWISAPSFNGDPAARPHARLTAIIGQMNEERDSLRAAPYVVFDLRGNGGGSSHWSMEMARALWGQAWIDAHPEPGSDAVDWRASADNLKAIEEFRDSQKDGGDPALLAWAQNAVDGMTAARAEGQAYWREQDDGTAEAPTPVAATDPLAGPVYVLTDAGCASACLDAVDLWKSLGAMQVGRETSADTVYMEIRGDELPSGLARIGVPMKVYRGRPRGNNEPQRPIHLYDGDMADDAALQAFVRGLAAD